MANSLPVHVAGATTTKINAPVSRLEFYHQANILKGPEDFSQIIYHKQPGGFAPVLKPLLPEGLALDSSVVEVEEKLGKAQYVLKNEHQVNGHMVWFYRRDMGPYLMANQFHFFQGRLVYVESRFIERTTTEALGQEVLHRLIRRYAGADSHENAFQDERGNRLWVEERKEVFVLHYLTGDASLKSKFPAPSKFRRRDSARRAHLRWLRDSA